MLDSFFPPHTPDLVHSVFGSLVSLLEFFLFLVESFEDVVFCHNDLGHQQKIIVRLVRRCCVRMLGVGNFAPVTPGGFCGGLRHSVAPGASGCTVASTLTSGC